MGYNPLTIGHRQITTPSVIEELDFKSLPIERLRLALEVGKITSGEPHSEVIEEIEKASMELGDCFNLSKTDKEVLALSLKIKREGAVPILVSDDYAIQNVAEYLGVTYKSLINFGIRYRFKWILFCPACRRKYPVKPTSTVCKICGTKLKRRVLRKKPVKKRGDKSLTVP